MKKNTRKNKNGVAPERRIRSQGISPEIGGPRICYGESATPIKNMFNTGSEVTDWLLSVICQPAPTKEDKKMRDPKRIPKVMKEVEKQWVKVSDWRLGQFMMNFLNNSKDDPFFWEDDEFVKRMKQYFKGGCK